MNKRPGEQDGGRAPKKARTDIQKQADITRLRLARRAQSPAQKLELARQSNERRARPSGAPTRVQLLRQALLNDRQTIRDTTALLRQTIQDNRAADRDIRRGDKAQILEARDKLRTMMRGERRRLMVGALLSKALRVQISLRWTKRIPNASGVGYRSVYYTAA